MELTTSLILQISAALLLCFFGLIFGLKSSVKTIIYAMVLLIPFQLLETRFGTLNVALAYFFSTALFFRKYLRYAPLQHSFSLLLLFYLLSFSQVHPAQNVDHFFYLVSFLSAYLVFLTVYNFARFTDDYRSFINILHIMNVLVIGYNILQMAAGDNNSINFGGDIYISIVSARTGGDTRLAGPFGSTMPGLLAEYLVISILMAFYDLIHSASRNKRLGLLALIVANFGCLVATGNRGGLVGLILFFVVMVFIMRKTLGIGRIIKFSVFGALLFAAASVVIVKFTSYDRLFERLAGTEIENGLPDTRAKTWPAALELFKEKPILGHGPRLNLYMEDEMNIPDHKVIDPPHNLYLYILCTTGIVGLLGFVGFFICLLVRVAQRIPGGNGDAFLADWPKVGLLLVAYVLFDQFKIEFLRFTAVDFWHYLFMLFGLILGLSDRKKVEVHHRREAGDGAEFLSGNGKVARPHG